MSDWMSRSDDIVTASEIAAWAWCPESWRLSSLGHEPGNRAAMRRSEKRHVRTAIFESVSTLAIRLGVSLLIAAVLASVLAFVLVRG